MLTDAYLNRLDALRLAIKHPARGGAGGARRSRSLGSSAEFSDFREYVPGDDVRRLDWNAYARFDKLFMKLFAEEQESSVTILMDGSASMQSKREDAIKAAEALGYLALCGGDRLRVIWLCAGRAELSPVYAGRRAYPQLAGFVKEHAFEGPTDLTACVKKIEAMPRGMCFLISDGYQPEGLGQVLDLLRYRRQETALVQPLSAFEMEPALEGAVRLKDAEGAPDMDILADGAALRQYQETLQGFLRECRGACQSRGTGYLLLDGRKPFEDAFLPALSGAQMI